MSLQPQPAYVIPDETRRIALAVFPKGGALCLRLVEALGQLYLDEQFAALFPIRGQPAASPARLALVLVRQYGDQDKTGAELRILADRTTRLLSCQPWMRKPGL